MSAQSTGPNAASNPGYNRPGWFARKVAAPSLNTLIRLGFSVWGARVLEHRGRKSGATYRTPVNLLTVGDDDFLVSARGETEWVRNVRAAGGKLTLLHGRRRQERTATEVPEAERAAILRAYLRRWKFEVGMFFEGVGPDSSDAEFAAVAGQHPVFRLQ